MVGLKMDKSQSTTAQRGATNSVKLILVLGAVFILGSTALLVGSKPKTPPGGTTTPETPPVAGQPVAPKTVATTAAKTVVYGSWGGNSSEISAVNTDGTNDSLIARLAFDIKDVNVISSATLLYVADTNKDSDHGRRIVLYDLDAQSETTLVAAEKDWGIDDVVVSPSKKWIAWWEVQLAPTGKLVGGKSRVYSANIGSPGNKHLVFNEVVGAANIVHYPLFFDHADNLYTDTFKPNAGAGAWNLGLFRTTADGKNPTQVLAGEKYNSDPVLNPVQNTIAFSGYNAGSASVALFAATDTASVFGSDANLSRNEVDLLDLTNLQQRSLLAGPSRYYNDLVWSHDGNSLWVRSFQQKNGVLTSAEVAQVQVATGAVQPVPANQAPDKLYLAATPDGFLVGDPIENEAPANLGSIYAPQLAAIEINAQGAARKIVERRVQYIGLIDRPDGAALGMQASSTDEGAPSVQLGSFAFKPEIEQRTLQQTNGDNIKCKDLLAQLVSANQLSPDTDYRVWKKTVKKGYVQNYKCYDSPLYLYAEKETDVSVKVDKAEIVAANPPYKNGWETQATPEGTKIDYAYVSEFDAPETGLVVTEEDLQQTLVDYAQELGLNEREADDFVAFWTTELPAAPYYLVSHFSNPAGIMGIKISPEPDVLLQVVMYFKPLSGSSARAYKNLLPPSFDQPPARSGLTVVDWSGIID